MHKVRCAPLPWMKQPRSCKNNILIDDLCGVEYCESVLDELRLEMTKLQERYLRATRKNFRSSHDLACGCPSCTRNKVGKGSSPGNTRKFSF